MKAKERISLQDEFLTDLTVTMETTSFQAEMDATRFVAAVVSTY